MLAVERSDKVSDFLTRDIWLASFISLKLNISPTLTHRNGDRTVIFSFPGEDEVYRAAADFNAGGSVPAAPYGDAVKALRTQMYRERAEQGNG
jgi:hypothetical protein